MVLIKTVAQELHELKRRASVLEETLCAECRHPYLDHADRCWYPRVRAMSPDKSCRCKRFVDPAERLPL